MDIDAAVSRRLLALCLHLCGNAADAAKVLRAMARLPTEQRAVLSLFALEGLKHKEIAEVLGVPEGTVWSRLHAARKRLQMELE